MRRADFVAASAALAALPALGAVPAAPEPDFAFRSSYWTNLHHRLYRHAELREKRRRGWWFAPGEADVLANFERVQPDARAAWESAVAVYRDAYVARDLLFDAGMTAIDRALMGVPADTAPSSRDLPAPLLGALALASPPYRDTMWPADDRGNREWIDATERAVAAHGAPFRRALPRWFAAPWLPLPYRVEVVYDAQWAGMYSDYGPAYANVFASSGPHGTHGAQSVELMFHEAAHSLVDADAGPVARAIREVCSQARRPVPRDLWHVLIFFTTGLLAESVFRAAGQPYTMYVVAQGLYDRGWAPYRAPVERFWPRYLTGRETMRSALAQIVAELG